MCGRYVIADQFEEFSERLQARQIRLPLAPTYNAAPSQALPVVVQPDGERTLELLSWGLVPRWRKPGERVILLA